MASSGLLLIIASKTLLSLSVPIPGKEKFMLAYIVQDIVQKTKHKQNKHELTRQDSLPSFSSLHVGSPRHVADTIYGFLKQMRYS